MSDVKQTKGTITGKRGKSELRRSIADTLRRRLAKERLPQGTKLPSLRSLAADFKVSAMTVRRAIQTLEAEGHIYRIPAVGTFIQHSPSRKAPTDCTVAFAAVDLRSTFEIEIAHGVEKTCQQYGWGIQLFDAQHDEKLNAQNLNRILHSGADGAIIMPCYDSKSVDMLFKLKSANFSFVLVDRAVPGLKADVVESNHERGAYLATRRLIELGHNQLLMLSSPATMSSVADRVRGFQRALDDAGIKTDGDNIVWADENVLHAGIMGGKRWLGGYQAILPVLKAIKPPVAILTIEDRTGWGVYQACRELGLRIPEDVSVICFDDSEIARAMIPPMTSIAQRTEEIGRLAVELLGKRLQSVGDKNKSPDVYTHMVVDMDLVERRSVMSLDH